MINSCHGLWYQAPSPGHNTTPYTVESYKAGMEEYKKKMGGLPDAIDLTTVGKEKEKLKQIGKF